ncbi:MULTISPECIES: EAL domain-containing protein [unclassified Halomonas]|uniref:bifunctional diguanylate cyclase/phosphodiesterase n=1 Tax=unclassified Halomonas TaxID=2609666 RepID=UPI0020767921|nr:MULTISPECIES: EAL domain-containing protein [unclassified Halomonas]
MLSDSAPSILQQLSRSLLRSSREEFFEQLTHSLSALLGVDHVLVARIDAHQSLVSPVTLYSNGQWLYKAPFPIKGTACSQVTPSSEFFAEAGICSRFPKDAQLAALDAQGYLGVPMLDADGNWLGLMALIHSSPLTLPDFAVDTLRIAASLASFELSRRLAGANANVRIAGHRRALKLLSEGGEAVFSAQNETALMQSCCDVAVGTGGYAAAWISRPDLQGRADSLSVRTMADRDGQEIAWCSPRQLMIKRYSLALTQTAFATGKPVFITEPDQAGCVNETVASTLRALGVKAFIALPLMFRDTPLGVLCCYHAQETGISKKERKVLSDLANDIAFGLDSILRRQNEQRIQHAVTHVATAVSANHGEAFLSQLTAHMATALDAQVGFIAKLDALEPGVASMVSLNIRGEEQPGIRYRIDGVPCEDVIDHKECVVLKNASVRMPAESNGELDWVNGYIGRRLDDAQGNPIGVVGVMFEQPLEDTHIARTVLQIFAARVASELSRQQDESRIRELAYRDEGTRLPNRADFMQRLVQHVGQTPPQRLALLLLGLNHFKEINDIAGHYVGDLVLKEVAKRFSTVLKERHYLARLGGDEFVVLCLDAGQREAIEIATRLQDALMEPVVVEQHTAEVSASVGVSVCPEQARTAQGLLRYADIAMHQAKRAPSGARLFEPWMEQVMREKLDMAKRLAIAIADKTLTLNFQPQVNLRTRELIGAEALCRWQDEVLGFVSPGDFIPLAEERGMMVALGRCVIEKACQQLSQWKRQGVSLCGQLAINVAADQFDDNDLIDTLFESCSRYHIAPSMLSLELTESGIMVNPEEAVAITRYCKEQGMGLAIDDFGTGYSSLAYLKRFAVDKIKIDISFIRDMLVSENDRVIVATIIAMAHTLGLETIAEGIEGQAQIEPLLEMGCTQGQGYLFDRPLTASQFATRWLQS